jgi:hypothetical protein
VVLPAPLHPARPITFIYFSGTGIVRRHCEEQTDEAIPFLAAFLDCFASLAMTTLAAFGSYSKMLISANRQCHASL